MKKDKRNNIEPLVIRGADEFFKAYGIATDKQSEMRKKGLPCYHDGKCYLYFPDEVENWIKANWKLNLPDI